MKPRFLALAASAVALSVLSGVARADVKIVAEVKTTGMPTNPSLPTNANKPVTQTVYYKGKKQRVEVYGIVSITDSETGMTTILDPAKKTFYVSDPAEVAKAMAANPMLAMIKMDTTAVDVKSGGQSKTIAGKAAKNYKVSATLKMGMEGGDDAMASMFPTVLVKNEQWVTEGIALPISVVKDSAEQYTKNLPPFFQKGLKPYIDKMGTIQGFPLASTVIMEFVFANGSPGIPGIPKEPIVTTTEVKEISEAPLDDALFTVPSDYKKVEPPTPGAIPGGGGAVPPSRP
jgi:hypothetical protein